VTPAPLVYIAGRVHDDALAELSGTAELVFGYGGQAVPLDRVAGDVVAILIRKAPFGRERLAACGRLRLIARVGVGVDNIDVGAATEHGVAVCNVPDGNTVAVAEHVFALLLAVHRRVVAGDRAVREDRFGHREAMTGEELRSRRLGLVGFGRIGAEVARMAREGFRMRTAAYDPGRTDREIAALGAEQAGGLAELLSTSDAVSLHVPLTPRTRGLIGAAELALLPPGAVLVHTARGGVVDERALYEGLRAGRPAAAGVDVFEQEPPPPHHPFFGLDNLVLTPHVAGVTSTSLRHLSLGAVAAVGAMLAGGRPRHIVNPEAWRGSPAPLR
jgi:phosphoglycerate dehydrogenase-like enzyme